MKLNARIFTILTTLTVTLAFLATSHADSVNEKKVLKKAGGNVDGDLFNLVRTTTPDGGGTPIVETSFDRTGSVKIPKKKGSASSTVVHDGPERDLDSTSSGRVTKTKVKRGGSKVKYNGQGETTPILESDLTNFTGSVQATSKVKGKTVKPNGNIEGSRVKMNGDTEFVTGNVSGEGKF